MAIFIFVTNTLMFNRQVKMEEVIITSTLCVCVYLYIFVFLISRIQIYIMYFMIYKCISWSQGLETIICLVIMTQDLKQSAHLACFLTYVTTLGKVCRSKWRSWKRVLQFCYSYPHSLGCCVVAWSVREEWGFGLNWLLKKGN